MAKRKPKPLKSVDIQIHGNKWKARLYKPEDYIKIHGDESGALIILDEKEIHFRNDENFCIEKIGHELNHAYWPQLCLDSTESMEIERLEEIMSSYVGNNIVSLYENTMTVFRELSQETSKK